MLLWYAPVLIWVLQEARFGHWGNFFGERLNLVSGQFFGKVVKACTNLDKNQPKVSGQKLQNLDFLGSSPHRDNPESSHALFQGCGKFILHQGHVYLVDGKD